MDILSLIMGHKHYWGIPHVDEKDKRLIQICYECGARRLVQADLQPSFTPERPGPITASSGSAVAVRKAA